MFKGIKNFFKKIRDNKKEKINKESAKERLHLVLLQDRANVSADFLEMMKQEIIEVIKKYIDIDEKEIDVKLTNKQNSDGTTGAPALNANIPIVAIKSETRKMANKINLEKKDDKKIENKNNKEKNEKNRPNEKQNNNEDKSVVKKEEKQSTENKVEIQKKEDNKNNLNKNNQNNNNHNKKNKKKK